MRRYFLLVVIWLALTPLGWGLGVTSDWYHISSQNITVYYHQNMALTAQLLLAEMVDLKPSVGLWVGDNSEPLRVVLKDGGGYVNGYVNSVASRMVIFAYPPSPHTDLADYRLWLRTIALHEMTHWYQLHFDTGFPKTLNQWFGNVYSLNSYLPTWLVEGTAVVAESGDEPGVGRLHSAYHEAVVRRAIYDNRIPSLLDLSYEDPVYPATLAYVWGGLFVDYLASRTSARSVSDYFASAAHTIAIPPVTPMVPAWGYDQLANEVWGKPFESLYAEWISALKKELPAWQEFGTQLTHTGWNKDYMAYADDVLYVGQEIPGDASPFTPYVRYRVDAIDLKTGQLNTVAALSSALWARIMVTGNAMYYAVEEQAPGYVNADFRGYGSVGTLMRKDLKSGRQTALFTTLFRDYAVVDGDLFFLSDTPSGSVLWRWTAGASPTKLATVDAMIGELAPWRDGWVLVTKAEGPGWELTHWDPKTMTLRRLLDAQGTVSDISVDGDTLTFSHRHDGYSAVYQMDLVSTAVHRVTHGTFADRGVGAGAFVAFRSLGVNGDELFVATRNPQAAAFTGRELAADRADAVDAGEHPAEANNLASLFPHTRIIAPSGGLLVGQDVIGYTTYGLLFLAGGAQFYASTQVFSPWVFSVTGQWPFSDGSLGYFATASYPLYRSKVTFLRDVLARIGYDGSIVSTGLTLRHYDPISEWSNQIEVDTNGRGLSAAETMTALIGDAEATVTGRLSRDFLTRYSDTFYFGLQYENGVSAQLKLTQPILAVHEGISNPQLYLNALYGNLFLNLFSIEDQTVPTIPGVSLSAELSSWQLHLVPEAGVIFPLEQSPSVYLSVTISGV
ncbi:MAG: hypothetical protein AAB066_00315 [Candidatus Margulisiibacteriota bacterium]